jgi:hypothetical protein
MKCIWSVRNQKENLSIIISWLFHLTHSTVKQIAPSHDPIPNQSSGPDISKSAIGTPLCANDPRNKSPTHIFRRARRSDETTSFVKVARNEQRNLGVLCMRIDIIISNITICQAYYSTGAATYLLLLLCRVLWTAAFNAHSTHSSFWHSGHHTHQQDFCSKVAHMNKKYKGKIIKINF